MANKLPPIEVKFNPTGLNDVNRAFNDVITMASKAESLQSKLSQKTVSDSEKSSRARVSSEERATRQIEATKEASFRKLERWAAKAAATEVREAEKANRALEKEASKAAKTREKFFGSLGGRGGSPSLGLGSALGLLTSIGGAFGAADSLRYGMQAESAAAKASVASNGEVSRAEILRNSKATSLAYGMNQKDVIEGSASYVAKTGDSKGAQQLQDFFAKVSIAEGVDVKELAGAAGLIKAQNKNLDANQIKSFILSAVQQGKTGAVEIGDMATSIAKATATAGRFSGDQVTNQRKLAGMTQIAMAATGSPEEAATAVSHLSDDILKHKAQFDKYGIRTTDAKTGRILDMNQIVADAISKTKGNPEALRKFFGERSGRIPQALTGVYDDAEKKQKGSGNKALLEYMQAIQDGKISMEQLNKDFAEVSNTTEFKLNKSFNELKMTLGTALMPILESVVNSLPKIIKVVDEVVTSLGGMYEWFSSHPMEAALLALAGSITATMAGGLITGIVGAIAANPIAIAAATIAVTAGVITVLEDMEKKKSKDKGKSDAEEEAKNIATLKADVGRGPQDISVQETQRIEAEKNAVTFMEGDRERKVKEAKQKIIDDKVELDAPAMQALFQNESQKAKRVELENEIARLQGYVSSVEKDPASKPVGDGLPRNPDGTLKIDRQEPSFGSVTNPNGTSQMSQKDYIDSLIEIAKMNQKAADQNMEAAKINATASKKPNLPTTGGTVLDNSNNN